MKVVYHLFLGILFLEVALYPGHKYLDPIATPWWDRYAASLVADSDGFLYLAGGFGGRSLVERYNPATNGWSDVNNTLEEYRLWAGGVYLEGTIYLVGGAESISHESLRLTDSFCESTLLNPQSAVGVNGEIVYTVELHASDRDQPNARLVAPLDPNQNFAGFFENGIGAIYTPRLWPKKVHDCEACLSGQASKEQR